MTSISKLFSGSVFFLLAACGIAKPTQSAVDNLPYHEPFQDPHWIYNGAMPHLQDAKIVASIAGHTVRITGFVPANFDASQIPTHFKKEVIDNRTRVTVVYPIATANLDIADDAPGRYTRLEVYPYTPAHYNERDGRMDLDQYGGFPFMQYVGARAFHGPITTSNGQWQVRRGSVSHGCNRMQGEHVVEFAHLIGVDMRRPYDVDDLVVLNIDLKVIRGLDTIPDGIYAGKKVDVDYEPWDDSVVRPADGDRVMFQAWDARDNPKIVCGYRRGRAPCE